MLSMEMTSSQEQVLFQSQLTHITIHTRLLMGIMQKPPYKLQMSQMSLTTLQEVCALTVFFITLAFTDDVASLCHPACGHFVR